MLRSVTTMCGMSVAHGPYRLVPRAPRTARRQQRCRPGAFGNLHLHTSARRLYQRASVLVRASNNNNDSDDNGDGPSTSSAGIPAGLLLFVGSAAYTLTAMRDELGDLLADDDSIADFVGIAGLGLGDLAGAALWSAALWYCSPWQLLLVFLGRIESDRPSDWIMNKLGRATGQDVDAIDYSVPVWMRAVAGASCLAGGVAVAALLGSSLGDPTWSISSGIGALAAAAIFEVGRPARLSVAEAQQLESQWQDFAGFADRRLQRSGRCHESEVFTAFRQIHAKYRSDDVLNDSTMRDMVRNWHPAVERTRTGYLRNISLRRAGSSSSSSATGASSSSSSSSVVVQQQQQPGQQLVDVGAAGSSSSAEPSLLDNIAEAAAAEQVKQEAASGSSSSDA